MLSYLHEILHTGPLSPQALGDTKNDSYFETKHSATAMLHHFLSAHAALWSLIHCVESKTNKLNTSMK